MSKCSTAPAGTTFLRLRALARVATAPTTETTASAPTPARYVLTRAPHRAATLGWVISKLYVMTLRMELCQK
jgi:hypothetical protein